MASPRCTRLEVWSNLQCAGGTRLVVIPDLLAAQDVHAVSGENQLTIRLPLESAAYASLAARRVLRVVFADDSFEEWRILKASAERTPAGSLLGKVEAGDPYLALGDATIYRTEADGTHTHQFDGLGRTAAQHLSDFILPALATEGYTWVAAGTIDDIAPIDLVYDYTTPLAAVQYLAQALGLEFQFRRNGTTQYLVDLRTRIGSSAATRYIRAGRDLQRLLRDIDAAPMATRVLPKGADEGGLRATMAEAEWRVAAITASTDVTLEDPLGGDPPIGEDDQLNLLYLEKPNGTRVQITDSVESTQKASIADTTGLSVGSLVKIRKTSGGEVLDYLESPAQKTVAGYGLATKVLDLPDIPGTVNRVSNPAMRTYSTASNAPPDSWESAPGSSLAAANIDKETTPSRWRVGGASAKVVAAADGQGIGPGWETIAPTTARPYVSAFMGFWNDTDSSKLRVELLLGLDLVAVTSMTRATAGGITTVTVNTGSAHGRAVNETIEIAGAVGATTADGYNGVQRVTRVVDTDTLEFQLTADPGTISGAITMRRVWHFKTPGNPATKTWLDLGIANIDATALDPTVPSVAKVRVVQDGATGTTHYVDRAQITLGSGEGQRPFIEGSGPVRLWQAANLHRRDFAPPATRYEVALLDLARLDGTTWAYEDLVLGQTIVAVDPDVPGSPLSTRLVDLTRDLLVEAEVTAGLSTRAADITDALVRPVRSDRWNPTRPGGTRRVVAVRFQAAKLVPKTPTDAANLLYNLAGGSSAGLYPINGATALASGSVADERIARGARIVGLRSDLRQQTAGAGTLKLYRDTTLLATLTAGSDLEVMNATLSDLVGSGAYWVESSLQQVSASIFAFLTWFELLLEIDE